MQQSIVKKKIFFIMNTSAYSGAEKVNLKIIKALRDKYDFYWVSQPGDINKYLEREQIPWIGISHLCVRELKRVIRENRPDLLHATDYTASVTCSLAHTRIPFIAHIHNNAPWIKKFCLKSLAFLYAGSQSGIVLTVSDAIREEYVFSKALSSKICCVRNSYEARRRDVSYLPCAILLVNLLVSAIFEPDYGSFLRHEVVFFPLMLEVVLKDGRSEILSSKPEPSPESLTANAVEGGAQ